MIKRLYRSAKISTLRALLSIAQAGLAKEVLIASARPSVRAVSINPKPDWEAVVKATIPPGGIIAKVGSRATCSPPPTDTDEDYLILVDNLMSAEKSLMELGFEGESDPEKISDYQRMGLETGYSFRSLRLGEVNYIITDSPFFFERFLTGAYVSRALNVLDKKDRILVHSAIRGATYASQYCPDFKPNYDQIRQHAKRINEETVVIQTVGELDEKLEEAVANNIYEKDLPF